MPLRDIPLEFLDMTPRFGIFMEWKRMEMLLICLKKDLTFHTMRLFC